MNEPAKKPAPANATPSDTRQSDVPVGYDARMQWINLIPKDLTIGGASLFNRVEARKATSPTGNDIYWSRADRHYWVGRYVNNELTSSYRIHETLIGTSQEWNG